VIVASMTVCLVTWFVIERTRLGATLRAATENPKLVQAFGVNVPLMGSSLVVVVFAVVVIGGMGSILGAIVSGLVLGMVEGFTKVIYPEASNIVVFVIMAIVLVLRPAGLFGRE
ncbi:MAG: branched-chain amino acid ABC transporter permease, partial [Ramlibacter sp.]